MATENMNVTCEVTYNVLKYIYNILKLYLDKGIKKQKLNLEARRIT